MLIPRKIILALRQIAPKSDIRHYLNGVRVEPSSQGVYLTATDGIVLIRVLIEGETVTDPFLIPSEILRKVSKGGSPMVEAAKKDNFVELFDKSGVIYTAPLADYCQLDVDKVIPKTTTGEPAHYNTYRLVLICGALATLGVTVIELKVNGKGAALFQCTWPDEDSGYTIDALIMPIK
jgi:hypothetical protein